MNEKDMQLYSLVYPPPHIFMTLHPVHEKTERKVWQMNRVEFIVVAGVA
jgi:hypothetical protein